MAKRRQLADGRDPNKTATLLDLLEVRCLISRAQADAGRYFGWLRRKIYGRTHVPALDPNYVHGHDTGGDCSDSDRLENQYRRICAALGECGPPVRNITEELCIYNRCDGPVQSSVANASAHLAMLRKGLDAIVQVRPVGGLIACQSVGIRRPS